MSARLDAFVICTPGLEPLVAAEIEKLGVRGPRVRHGGVDCSVTIAQLWSLNLRLRVATRVLVRIGRIPAPGFGELQAGLRRIDWAQWVAPGTAVEIKVASSASQLFHTTAIEERAAEVLGAVGVDVVADATTVPEGTPGQVLHVRLTRDVALVSIDSSGDPLYRRGWRTETAKAPLRETLAAALLQHSGWDRGTPLVDPFCGSGTIVIEAALTARRMAPGRGRRFAFEHWPEFDAAAWQRIQAGAEADIVARTPPLVAADRDEGALAAARDNATRAGVADAIEFRHAAVSDLELPKRAGWVVTNPPYGHRIAGVHAAPGADLRDLYDRFGTVLVERAAGWRLGYIAAEGSPAPRLRKATTEDAEGSRLRTLNGGLPIELVRATVRPRPEPRRPAE